MREPVARAEWLSKPEDEMLSLALQLGVTDKAHRREAGTQMTTPRSRATQMTCIDTSAFVYDFMETSAATHVPRDSMRRMSAEMSRDEMIHESQPADVQPMNSFTLVSDHHSSRFTTNGQGGFVQGYSASSRMMYEQRGQPSVSMLEESLAGSYQMPMPSQEHVLSEDSGSVALSNSISMNEVPQEEEEEDTASQGWFFKWGR